ncbi:MAG: TldD/PmbA family protein [Methanomicrobiales archaeon]|nr:TldD/PmbA family protein [Methanomicrobiales archaeon]
MALPGTRYFDIRRVRAASTHVDIDNGVVESAGTSFSDSSVIRVLGPRGWGIVHQDHFDPGSARERGALLKRALSFARITERRVDLAPAPSGLLPVPALKEDPRTVSLEEKTGLLTAIATAARVEGVTSTRAQYTERAEQVSFLDSSGHEAGYEVVRSGFSVLAVASRNGVVQMGRESRHTLTGLNLRHQEALGRVSGERAVALLSAPVPKGGRMRAVLDPELAGVFAHEAVGHASEGDLVLEGSSVLQGRMGDRIGTEALTIVDDPTLPEFGFEPVDAEGVLPSRTEIISRGRVAAYLHNRETMAALGNGVPGHARAMEGDAPIVRMSNTFIENGDATRDEILEECGEGILLIGSRGGQVDPGRGVFQFNAEYGYRVEKGSAASLVRDVSLSGEILATLHDIILLGKDRAIHQGYCGKGGQSVPVSDGAPHVLLDRAVVGGAGGD